jgi:hypothetical protein
MWDKINSLISIILTNNGINDKTNLSDLIQGKFNLIEERSVYRGASFSIRFSKSQTPNMSNTVLSLSNLRKYDQLPFIVCIVCPDKNYLLLANTTFLKKISHSSQSLSMENIKGSFNGSDIMREYQSISNSPENFQTLFQFHSKIGFTGNLLRLVNETNAISPTGKQFNILDNPTVLCGAPNRALAFINSIEFKILKDELDGKVSKWSHQIHLAALIPNVNIRGRLIEYFITGEDENLKEQLSTALIRKQASLPKFKTEDDLGDYKKVFDAFYTETDIKTKLMFLNSNPKAYNIDKMLEFLSIPKSVFLFYFLDIEIDKSLDTYLISMFDERIINSTRIQPHWAGRNSRGVTQLEGKIVNDIIANPDNKFNINKAINFLKLIVAGHVT